MKVSNTEKWQHFYSKGKILEGSTDKHMAQTIENKETVLGDVKPSGPIAKYLVYTKYFAIGPLGFQDTSGPVVYRDEITLTRNDLTVMIQN